MKPKYAFILISTFALAAISCSDDHDPKGTLQIHPIRMEMEEYHRELIYDQNNRLTGIKMISLMLNEEPAETILSFFYSAGNRIDSAATTDGNQLKFTYEAGLITRTDAYVNESLSHYHTFAYDERQRVTENIYWQYMAETDGWAPHQKGIYTYDINDNLIETVLYYYNTSTNQHELLTRFIYSDYDNNPNADQLFNTLPFNPLMSLSKNNPGKMIVKNRHGDITSTEDYSYQYNSSGYPTKCTTSVTFLHNGQDGSYEIAYIYEFR